MWSKQEIEQNSEQGVIDDVPAWCPWAWMGWLWICHHDSLFINVLIVFSWVFCVKCVKQTQVCKSSTVINLTTLCYNEQLSDKHASINQNELIPRRHAAQMEFGIGCPLLASHPYSAVCHNLCWQLAAFLKECPLTRHNKFTTFWLVTSILRSQKKQTAFWRRNQLPAATRRGDLVVLWVCSALSVQGTMKSIDHQGEGKIPPMSDSLSQSQVTNAWTKI